MTGCGGGSVVPVEKQNGRYFVTDAGPVDYADIGYQGVSGPNDLGQIVGPGSGIGCGGGHTMNGCYSLSPFVYTPGSGTSTLVQRGNLQGINNHGDAVGYADGTALVIKGGTVTPLPSLGGSNSYAFGINDAGQIVGSSLAADSMYNYHAVMWQSGVITDLGMLPGYDDAQAHGISNSGKVVGVCSGSNKTAHATMWHDGVIEDLGASVQGLKGGLCVAVCVNASGDCAGYYDAPGPNAIAWHNGSPIDLGPGQAFGIDDAGTVVGMAYRKPVDALGGFRAYLWAGSKGVDLNSQIDPSAGWVLTVACGINRKGQISGIGLHHGVSRAFLLTPQ